MTFLKATSASIEHVAVVHVADVRGGVAHRTSSGGHRLTENTQPRQHGQSSVLQFSNFHQIQIFLFGVVERVESTTRVRVVLLQSVLERVF